MSEALLVVIVASTFSLLTAGIGAAFTAWQKHRSDTTAPYDAMAKRLASVEERSDAQASELSEMRIRVEALERVGRAWENGWDDLRFRWPWWRAQETPPPYPSGTRDTRRLSGLD